MSEYIRWPHPGYWLNMQTTWSKPASVYTLVQESCQQGNGPSLRPNIKPAVRLSDAADRHVAVIMEY